jgi:hypothetical protein
MVENRASMTKEDWKHKRWVSAIYRASVMGNKRISDQSIITVIDLGDDSDGNIENILVVTTILQVSRKTYGGAKT